MSTMETHPPDQHRERIAEISAQVTERRKLIRDTDQELTRLKAQLDRSRRTLRPRRRGMLQRLIGR